MTEVVLNNITKRFKDVTAVNDVSFDIADGEFFVLLGPTGAGKTTTIKMLTGLLPPDEGTALIAGHDIQEEPIVAKQVIAYIPDTPNLYGKLKAIEFLRFMAQLYHVPGEVAEERIKRYLDVFELTDRAGDYLEGFSHGMQQKVAITGALLHDPEPRGELAEAARPAAVDVRVAPQRRHRLQAAQEDVAVSVHESRQHGAAAEVDHLGARSFERRHVGLIPRLA